MKPIEILPSILARSEEDFRRRVNHVRGLGLTLHIDVMDGAFVDNTSWAPPRRMQEMLRGMSFEVHLMVTHPEKVIEQWAEAGASRIFFHAEATAHINASTFATSIFTTSTSANTLGIALNPETPITALSAFPLATDVLMMGVHPGWSDQIFLTPVLEKIRGLVATHPEIRILVDGGVSIENIRDMIDAGASRFVMGHALTNQQDPVSAYQEILKLLGT